MLFWFYRLHQEVNWRLLLLKCSLNSLRLSDHFPAMCIVLLRKMLFLLLKMLYCFRRPHQELG